MASRLTRALLRDGGLLTVAAQAAVLRALGAVLGLGLYLVIGRLLGAVATGHVFVALSVIGIAAVVTRFGLENTVLRFVAARSATQDPGGAAGIIARALAVVTLASVLAAAGLALAAPWLAQHVFAAPDLAPILSAMAVALVGLNLLTLLGEALKGLSRLPAAMAVNGILHPLTSLALIWPLQDRFGATGVAMAYAGGAWVAALVGLILTGAALRGHWRGCAFPAAEMWASCRPLWVSMIVIRAVQPWVPVLLLSLWASASETAIFGMATRLALAVSFFLLAINGVLAPRFAALHATGDHAAMARLARRYGALVTLAASPVFALFILAGGPVMGLAGPAFAEGGAVLAILAVGQLINAWTGPVGVILMMGGREADMRRLAFLSVALLLGLALWLIPAHGVIGAALASMVAGSTASLVACVLARRLIGSWPMPWLGRLLP